MMPHAVSARIAGFSSKLAADPHRPRDPSCGQIGHPCDVHGAAA